MMPVIALYAELAVTFHGDALLGELVFPICECCLAYLNLYSKLEYYPLILHTLAQLVSLMERTKVRFSLCKNLLELLRAKRVRARPSGARSKQFPFEIRAKASAEELGDELFWNDFSARVLFLIERQFLLAQGEPYFAAFVHSVSSALKAQLKSKSSLEVKKGVARLVC